ncbi:bifunctional 2-polyprenyl-6-hydroxyphenol methylase/3-demethylubiquinol 3-O-methyltransferase UbiG [Austwickia sp. TVS 96-490-7B]|uniref:class I SAM-dependent methyltransferase n=1 Tax=Austwickia sp. TVS 96-490-7B TaxID=2830843 RepID=UPI001C59B9CA|nr:class I SAM-dependent methyltransferase [Austwickia sp. TVS 96-490-7B]
MSQDAIDAAIQSYYRDAFDEGARLTTRSMQGRLEFERTQEIVRASTPAPARVLDVGGATGVHSASLAAVGYDVVLVEPVESQVQVAQEIGTFDALVGDARDLPFEADSFDAVLIAGPLYHLAGRNDRLQALREAVRVCRTGGFVHAAAIPRFLAFAVAALNRDVLEQAAGEWISLLREGVPPKTVRFPAGHFHTPEELEEEMTSAGLRAVTVVGLEGPAALGLETASDLTESDYDAATHLARTFATSTMLRNFSCHLLGTGQVG